MSDLMRLETRALSNADALGYLGQSAIAEAAGARHTYLIIGGHMVRLHLLAHPTPQAVPRSTLDADTAVPDVEVVGALMADLISQGFTPVKGNVLTKEVDADREIEINVLLPRADHTPGIRAQDVPEVGQVDTLPELTFALAGPAVELEMIVHLQDERVLRYRTRIPSLEAAVVLKAHSWKARGRRSERDLADLHTLFEIREAHPDIPWRLSEAPLSGRRKDSAVILHDLAERIGRSSSVMPVPTHLSRPRMAALIRKHIARP